LNKAVATQLDPVFWFWTFQLVRLFRQAYRRFSAIFELIPDTALTLTRKRCNEIQSQSKNSDSIELGTQNL